MNVGTLVEMLDIVSSDNKGILFINGEKEETFVTYNQIYAGALKVLNFLQSNHLKKGDEAVILIDNIEHFIYSFWGCLLGGIIPVPLTIGKTQLIKEKLSKVLNTLKHPKILTEDIDVFEPEDKEDVLFYKNIDFKSKDGIPEAILSSDIAFIQFSSGSTNDPKGVILTHENIITNLKAINTGCKTNNKDKTISWMPLTHDMGLIGFHLAPVYANIHQILMPPRLFIKHPLLYLEKAIEHNASILCSPNFGVKHLLKHVELNCFDGDLSNIRLIFNGAEPISYDFCRKFLERMKYCGLKGNTMFPVYGMAEASLAVTFPEPGELMQVVRIDRSRMRFGEKVVFADPENENAIPFVKVGRPVQDCEIMICDDSGNKLNETAVGNILIRGRNVTKGYYRNEKAYGEVCKDGWLYTGDLGFWFDNQLVITGRKKDIIFVNGQNYYPHDIERLIENMGNSKIKESVVCGVPNKENEDEIIVFLSSVCRDKGFLDLADEVRSCISSKIEKEIKHVIPVRQIPKTTSGKKQRYKLVEGFLRGEYQDYIRAYANMHIHEGTGKYLIETPVNQYEEKIREFFQDILATDTVPRNRNFFEMGGDSIKAAYLFYRIEDNYRIKLDIKDVFEDFTVMSVAKAVQNKAKSKEIHLDKVQKKDFYDVLPAQKKLFILNAHHNTNKLFNIIKVFNLGNEANTERIKTVLTELTKVHEALRTNFFLHNDNVVQKINDDAGTFFVTDSVRRHELDAYIKNFNSPFNLECDALFRMAVLNVDGEYKLVVCFHHIIMDGTSLGLFVRDFISLYNGSSLEYPMFSQKEYVSWRNRFMLGDAYKKQKEYWLNKYQGNIPVLDLPYDFKRPKSLSYKGMSIQDIIDAEQRARIKNYAELNRISEYIVFFSIFNILIHKLTMQREFVVGTPTAARDLKDIGKIIGMLSNTLPVKIEINPDMSVKNYISCFCKSIYSDIANSGYYSDELVEDLNLKPLCNRNPLYDVVFNMQNMSIPEIVLDGKCISEAVIPSQTSKVDLTVEIMPNNDCYSVTFEYMTDLFEEKTIRSLMKKYFALIDLILGNDDQLIKNIEIIDENEKEQIIYHFNDTKKDLQFVSFKSAFENQVNASPDNPAVYFGNQCLTYKELNEKANGLVSEIIQCNSSGKPCAILCDRGFNRVISLIACLKSGHAYLPIESSQPVERINYMLMDSESSILITDNELPEKISFTGHVISLKKNYAESIRNNPETEIQPDDIAFIIYTSGSTGKPKGVMAQQQNLSGYIYAFLNEFPLTQKDKFLQQASYAFDASVEEIFPILTVGGSISICRSEEVTDTRTLVQKIKEERITIISASPLIISELNKANCVCDVHTYISGGDVLKFEYIDNLIQKAKVYNTYGPTETTVCAAYYQCKPGDKNKNIPIGKPIANYQVLILNDDKLCPVGVPGELYIGGIGVSKGYLNNSALTNEKFVQTMYTEEKLFYRTGDLAKWLPDGNIEFLGRIDQQVKIRGFRIELGEIESVLLRMGGVTKAVVIDREDASGEKYLAAYIISDMELNVTQLRSYLSQYLPDYMLPNYYVPVPSIPVTTNGKIDKESLPDPITFIHEKPERLLPRNDTEKKLASSWCWILNLPTVGVREDFFESGGHSLKAALLVANIRQEFNVDISLSQVFHLSTIENIAQYIHETGKSNQSVIEKQGNKTYYDVSFAQGRLFALSHFAPDSTAYHITRAVMIEGKISHEKVAETFGKLIQRHESLRTAFKMVQGKPVQIVYEEVPFEIIRLKADYENVDNVIRDQITPFDLERAPLFRVLLAEVSEDKHLFVLDLHHIISDGVSISIIINDFIKLYTNEELSDIPVAYKDFASWQKRLMNTDEMKRQADFWLSRFSGEIPVLYLPTDFPRPVIQDSEGDCFSIQIDDDLYQGLKRHALEQNATMFMVFMAAYNILLHKYSQSDDIVVGTAAAGRNRAELENIVGMFVNTLAIRSYPEGKKTYTEFLEEVKQITLESFENQDFPFEELVRKLELQRDTSRNAVFDTMLVYQNMDIPELSVENLKIVQYPLPSNTSMFDLTLEVYEKKHSLELNFEYSTKLFKRKTIERLAMHFVNVLRTVAENPETLIKDIDILSHEEKNEILFDFNASRKCFPCKKSIPALFEEQVAKTPDNTAIICGEDKLTYRELNERANEIAFALRSKDVKPGDIVGIMTEVSLHRIAGILAILKSGAAYVPIDREFPSERIQYIMKDSGMAILLTDEELRPEISFDGEIINIRSGIGGIQSKAIRISNTLSDLAYIIYTSGTTGYPKGVMVDHGNLSAYVYAFLEEFDLNESDVILQQASYTFDTFVEELYPALVRGASVVLVHKDDVIDIEKLINIINQWRISVISCSPLLLNELNKYPALDSVHTFISGGDVLKPEYIGSLLRYAKVYNTYGPTESTVCASYYRCDPGTDYESIPIGKPITNYRIYIMDREQMLLPVNIPGELCISGDGVTRGYLNLDEHTSLKFCKDPFFTGERLYRTGDLARWLPDGNIEFLGRIDNQVNIKGYRIELGEIEAHLKCFDGIKTAIAVDREDDSGNKQLYAYFVSDRDVDVLYAREYLAKHLPDYMIPSYIIRIESIPVNSNGKIDKKALPYHETVLSHADYQEPTNEVERKLAEIWEKVLEVKNVGTTHNFFTLGGDSIKALQVISHLHQYKLKLSIKDIFLYPTIRELAVHATVSDTKANQGIVEGEVFLSPIQKWFFRQGFINKNYYSQSVLLMNMEEFEFTTLKRALEVIVRHHDALRMRYEYTEGYPKQINIGPGERDFILENYEISNTTDIRIIKDFIEKNCTEMQRKINLERGPLLVAGLFKTPEGDFLSIAIHHLVVDGVSWRILLEDLINVYYQLVNRLEMKLPEKTNSFMEWSAKLNEYANSEAVITERSYWNSLFHDGLKRVPASKRIECDVVKDTHTLTFTLSKEDTLKLLKEVHRGYNTEISEILLIILGLSLKKWCGDGRYAVMVEGHGRESLFEDIDISRTVGWFTSMFPVVLDMSKDVDLSSFIKYTKESLRAVPNKGIGYGILQYLSSEILQTEYLCSGIVPDISFNYLGQFDEKYQFEGTGITLLETSLNMSPDEHREHLLEINCGIKNGEFTLSLQYNSRVHQEIEAETFLDYYKSFLLDVIEHCTGKGETEMTPSDFAYKDFSIEELVAITEEINSLDN